MIPNILKNIAYLFTLKDDSEDKGLKALLNALEKTKNDVTDFTPIGISTATLLANDFPTGLSDFVSQYEELDIFKTDYDTSENHLFVGLSLIGINKDVSAISNPYLKDIVQKLQKRYVTRDENGQFPKRLERTIWTSQKYLAKTLQDNAFATIKHHHYLYKQMANDVNNMIEQGTSNTLIVDDVVSSFNDLGDIELVTDSADNNSEEINNE